MAGASAQKGFAQMILGNTVMSKLILNLLFVCLGNASAGVAGIKQHLVLVIGRVGHPKQGVIKNPNN